MGKLLGLGQLHTSKQQALSGSHPGMADDSLRGSIKDREDGGIDPPT